MSKSSLLWLLPYMLVYGYYLYRLIYGISHNTLSRQKHRWHESSFTACNRSSWKIACILKVSLKFSVSITKISVLMVIKVNTENLFLSQIVTEEYVINQAKIAMHKFEEKRKSRRHVSTIVRHSVLSHSSINYNWFQVTKQNRWDRNIDRVVGENMYSLKADH